MILNQANDKIFRRTIVGDSEIRERTLTLTRTEQTVLLSVDGEASFLRLSQHFAVGESAEFEMAMDSLLRKGLIEPLEEVAFHSHTDLLKAEIAGFETEDFFSSTGNGLHTGSGLVVDTRNNSVRSVNGRRGALKGSDEVDLFIPLAGEELGGRKKKRMQKLVEVYPDPSKQKRSKRRKRAAAPPENKWFFRVYLALIAAGLLAVVVALLFA